MMKTILCVIGLAAAACGCVPEKGPLVLAERGKGTAYEVVISAKDSPCILHAAEEFTNYVARLTGVALPIVEKASAQKHAIYLRAQGRANESDFRFTAMGRDFEIVGAGDRAVLFGVYDFFETMCGCEYLTSKQDVIPKLDKIVIPEKMAVERKPVFETRECGWTDAYENPDFAAKLKLTGYRFAKVYGEKQGGKPPAFDSVLGICHTMQTILPPQKYFKEHPEYFAQVNGKRVGEGRVQLCLSNPKVLEKTIAFVKERIRKNYPRVKCYGVSQSDTQGYCTCPNCKAIDAREGTPAGSIITFVNKVADAVKDEWPDVLIETLAYMYSRTAPKTLTCRDNVMIVLCTDTCDLSRPLLGNTFHWQGQSAFTDDLAQWQKIAKHIYTWDYAVNFRFLWHAFPSLWAFQPNYAFFADNGVKHCYMEGCHHGIRAESSELKLWVVSHLMWNPHQELQPLLERFLKGYYGAAAPWAMRYYTALSKLQKDESKTPQMMWGRLDSPALTDEFFDEAASMWREAMAAVKGDTVREKNVRWVMNMTDYTRIMRQKPDENPAHPKFAELQAAATRILADFEAETWSEGIRCFGEDRAVNQESLARIRRLAAMGEKKVGAKVTSVEPIIKLRPGLDFYEGHHSLTWLLNKDGMLLTAPKGTGEVKMKPYQYQLPVPGAKEITLTAADAFEGTVTLSMLHRKTKKIKSFTERAGRKVVFKTNLPFEESWLFDSLAVSSAVPKRVSWQVKSLKGSFEQTEAQACRVRIDTQNPINIVTSHTQKVSVVLKNPCARALSWSGVLQGKDFYGRHFEKFFAVDVAAYQEARIPLELKPKEVSAKGIWQIALSITAADKSSATQEVRLAVIDYHAITPKVAPGPGMFRPGIHVHAARCSKRDQVIEYDAAAAMGAKLVRVDFVYSSPVICAGGKGKYDWRIPDAALALAQARGLAVDALIFENLGWRYDEDFCTALSARYGTQLDFYEVGNEWDMLDEKTFPIARGVEIQKKSYAALKKGCPQCKVITNGWTVEDSNGHSAVVQKGFQERFLEEAKGFFDVHAIHLHGTFDYYHKKLKRFFELRREKGVENVPWFPNETAISNQYRGEEPVAEAVWQKLIHSWSMGAQDHVWYCQRATSQRYDLTFGYGMMSYDWKPALSYCAFSAFVTLFENLTFDKILLDGEYRRVYRCKGKRGGQMCHVVMGWDSAAIAKTIPITIRTDAKAVWSVDLMGNKTALKVQNGVCTWMLSARPSAILAEGGTLLEPDETALKNILEMPVKVARVLPNRDGRGWDFELRKVDFVHDCFPADPANQHRAWKGPDDLSGVILFTRLPDGYGHVRAYIQDDIFVEGGDRFEVWLDGKNITDALKFTRRREGKYTNYEADLPKVKPFRFNARFIDDDGFGGTDAWMAVVPFDPKNPVVKTWPVVTFE